MGNVADETTTIRELLVAKLDEIIAAIGGNMAELTQEQIQAIFDVATTPIALRQTAAAAPAEALYIPGKAGDTEPALVVGSADVAAQAVQIYSGADGLVAEAYAAQAAAIGGHAMDGYGARFSNQSTTYPVIWAQAVTQGVGLQSTTGGPTAIDAAVSQGNGVAAPVLKLRRLDSGSTTSTGLSILFEMIGLTGGAVAGLAGRILMYIQGTTSNFSTALAFYIRRNGNERLAATLDGGATTAGQTALQLEAHNGASSQQTYRVKVGPAGSGPGGTGRALYMD